MGTHPTLLSTARILLKWKSLIIILTITAAIVSAITALTLPVYYKSKVTFYPQNLAAFDRGYLFGTENKEKVQSLFGDKQDVNRVLSIANSTELQGFIQQHFNLPAHYGIDTTSPNWRYKMNKSFEKNFKVIKSELDNVELTIWDRDPGMASEIANYYVAQIDAIYSGLLGDRNQKNVGAVNRQVASLEQEMAEVSSEMAKLSDPSGMQYQVLVQKMETILKDYNSWKTLAAQYQAAADYEVSSLFIIENAYPSEKKDRPVRWIIVVGATLGAFFLSLVAALIVEQYRQIKADLDNA